MTYDISSLRDRLSEIIASRPEMANAPVEFIAADPDRTFRVQHIDCDHEGVTLRYR
jgi:hypothetical protein